MHNSDPTPQGVENRNILLWIKCILTALHVNCMILFDKVLLTRTGTKCTLEWNSVVIKDREHDVRVQVLRNVRVYFKWGWNKSPFDINLGCISFWRLITEDDFPLNCTNTNTCTRLNPPDYDINKNNSLMTSFSLYWLQCRIFFTLTYGLPIVHHILHITLQWGDFQKNEDFVWHRGWNFKLDKLT
jgi:hypothetical protein